MKKYILSGLVTICLVFVTMLCSCAPESLQTIDQNYAGLKHNDNYQLEQMTVLSRHNARSPLTDKNSKVSQNIAYDWMDWPSKPGDLTPRGGQNETTMGQYFKKYLEQEKLIPENWQPQGDETLFYTNAYQRTIATAEYFSAGMLPIGNQKISYKEPLGKDDPTFVMELHGVTNDFKAKVEKEVNDLFGGNYKDLNNKLYQNELLLENVIGYLGDEDISNAEVKLIMEEGKPPINTGFCNDLTPYADALVMQYYEEPDSTKAAFGQNLTFDDWKQIGDILSANMLLSGGSHTESQNSIKPMLDEVKKDMGNPNRKFTFLCGHDSTLTPFLSALDVNWKSLPYTITDVAPLGGKVVLSKFKNAAGEEFVDLNYVYASDNQLRYKEQLNLNNPPVAFPLELKGLQKNADGYYKLADIERRLSGQA